MTIFSSRRTILTVLALALAAGPLSAQTPPAAAVEPAPGDGPELFERPPGSPVAAARLRTEVVNGIKPGAALRLNLRPDAAAYRARVTKVSSTRLGSRVIHGWVEGPSGGSLLLVQHGGATVGNVWVSSAERYALDGWGSVRALTVQTPALCACAGDAPVEHRAPHFTAAARSAAVTSIADFDVLVVYTPAALKSQGGVDALTAQADLAMADANTCYQNSGIPIRGQIVGVRAVDYTESGEIRMDLHHLAFPDDGVLDEVQGYRDEAQADLVCMFTRRDSADGYRGYAEILTGLTPDGEILGYSVVDVQAATTDHLFAHELGHNMGCDHDRENTTGLRLFDFSYGWRFTGQDGTLYRDVMAYPPGASVAYFANPNVDYAGVPTGVADYADQARTITESAPAFVNFRAADGRGRVSVSAGVASSTLDATGKGRATFAFERTGSVAQALDVDYQTGGTAVGGVNYHALNGRLSFASGSHFAKLRVKPIVDAAPFGLETVTLSLTPGDAYVVADSPTGGSAAAAVTIYDRLPLVSLGKARRAGAAPGKLKVRVNRLGHIDGNLAVHYGFGGTAVAGVDYRAPAGATVTIPAGQNTAVILVRLLEGAGQPADGSRTIEVVLQPDAAYNVGATDEANLAF